MEKLDRGKALKWDYTSDISDLESYEKCSLYYSGQPNDSTFAITYVSSPRGNSD